MMQKGTEELQRRLFGTKPTPPPAAGEGDQIPESGSPETKSEKKRNSTEELIRKGLEGLFGR
jgi:hypothetical protein